ncbi:hypothetical protein [Saccharopolyspora sp. NPDC002376]
MKMKNLIKKLVDRRASTTPPAPLDEQLTDVARALIANEHLALATEVSNVIELSRGDISDSLYATFEDLLISLDWAEIDPNEEEAAEIRATLALIHKASPQ